MEFRRNIATLAGLIVLACLVQAWIISRAVVPAQDCVRYLIVAQGIERDGWTATLRSQPEQPLFPALVWLMHRLLTGSGLIDGENWAICLQVAAAVPLVLSVIPVHALFRRLHGEQAALVAALLYCVLSGIARLGADGLSDSTHLALFCLALWTAARYFAPGSRRFLDTPPRARPNVAGAVGSEDGLPRPSRFQLDGLGRPSSLAPTRYGSCYWLLLCGSCTGLALMARCESIVLPVAVFATLVLLQCIRSLRQSWLAVTQNAGAYMLGLGLMLMPYLAVCGAWSPSEALSRLTGRRGAAEAAPLNDFNSSISSTAVEPRWDLPGVGRLEFGKKDTSTSARFRGYLAASGKLLEELAQTLRYWIGALALVGLWKARHKMTSPLDCFLQCLCATLVTAAVCVAAQAGYLSTRHMLLLVVLGVGWAGAGALAIADMLTNWVTRFLIYQADHHKFMPQVYGSLARRRPRTAILVAITCLLMVACLVDCAAPLHASRGAHREAARWLTEHAKQSVAVLDSRGFTALYTGRKTYRYEAAQAAFSDPALAYVVVEEAELAAPSRRSQTMRLLVGRAGEPMARFATAGSQKHGVVIHRWRPEWFQQLGVQSYAR